MRSRPIFVALALGLAACGRLGFDAADGPAADDAPSPDVAACPHLFCDDLEDPLFGAWTGVTTDGGASAARDAAFGRAGGSLHAVSPAGSSEAARWVDAFPAQQVSDQWVRVMLFAPSGQMLDVEPVVMMDGTRSQELVFSLYDTDTDIHAHGIASDFNVTQPLPPPRDRWVCYELHVHVAAAGLVELYRDGALIVQHAGSTVQAQGTALGRVAVGIVSKPTTLSESLWIDDVAADTTRIGCP